MDQSERPKVANGSTRRPGPKFRSGATSAGGPSLGLSLNKPASLKALDRRPESFGELVATPNSPIPALPTCLPVLPARPPKTKSLRMGKVSTCSLDEVAGFLSGQNTDSAPGTAGIGSLRAGEGSNSEAAQAAGMQVVGIATQFSLEKLLDLGCIISVKDFENVCVK